MKQFFVSVVGEDWDLDAVEMYDSREEAEKNLKELERESPNLKYTIWEVE